MDIGTTLRSARERHHLTQAQLSRRTKIAVRHLQALEDNAFDRLPRGIFARGFLRAYATEVGLDPEPLIAEFLSQTAPAAAAPARPGPDIAVATPELDAPRPGRVLATYLLLAAGLALALVVYTRNTAPAPAPTVVDGSPGQVDTPSAAAAPPAGAEPTSGGGAQAVGSAIAGDVRPVAADGNQIHVEIEPSGPCWVEVRADGRLVAYRLMQAGEHESFDVRRDVFIRVGDPGAFSYTINGRPGRPVGRAGVPADLRFTIDTYPQFVTGP